MKKTQQPTVKPIRLRITVFRSNNFIYAQLIDDVKRVTVAASSDVKSKEKNKIKRAEAVGLALAQDAVKKGVTFAYFQKGSYRYHGRIKALADGARKGGLNF